MTRLFGYSTTLQNKPNDYNSHIIKLFPQMCGNGYHIIDNDSEMSFYHADNYKHLARWVINHYSKMDENIKIVNAGVERDPWSKLEKIVNNINTKPNVRAAIMRNGK